MVANPEIVFSVFFGSSYFQQPFFSAPAMVCHHVGIPASLVSFLHCFYILVEGLSLLFHHASKFSRK